MENGLLVSLIYFLILVSPPIHNQTWMKIRPFPLQKCSFSPTWTLNTTHQVTTWCHTQHWHFFYLVWALTSVPDCSSSWSPFYWALLWRFVPGASPSHPSYLLAPTRPHRFPPHLKPEHAFVEIPSLPCLCFASLHQAILLHRYSLHYWTRLPTAPYESVVTQVRR